MQRNAKYVWRGPGSLIYSDRIYRAGDILEISKEESQLDTIEKLINSKQLERLEVKSKKNETRKR